jgi:preprotein translocase subunit Sec63
VTFNPLDLAGAISSVINKLIELHRIDKWCRLVFTMAFSGIVSFLGTCGGAMTLHRTAPESIGAGMVSAAVMMTVLFRRSDLTKGMVVALPEEEARVEMQTDVQVVEKK